MESGLITIRATSQLKMSSSCNYTKYVSQLQVYKCQRLSVIGQWKYLDVNPLLFEKALEFVHQDALRHRDQEWKFEDV